MGKFVAYTIVGTLATFAIIVYMSLMPHLMQLPSFASGVTLPALLNEYHAFLLTLVLSWVAWWGVSGIMSLSLYSIGKHTGIALFTLSLSAVFGITTLIT